MFNIESLYCILLNKIKSNQNELFKQQTQNILNFCHAFGILVFLRSILSIVIELISLAQTTIDENKYGFRVSKNPNGYDWGK